MKQQCPLLNVWLTWLAIPALGLAVGYAAGWAGGALVVLAAIAAQVVYLRVFPAISRPLGYGSVADAPAATDPAPAAPAEVVLYTANLCPFCPLMRRRLAALAGTMGFTLREIDVTFRPAIVRAKGLRAVPVVEADGRLLHGNATSAKLAAFLAGRGS